MKEVAELDVLALVGSVGELLAEHGRQQHEVVIVDPDQVVILNVARDLLGEQPVGLDIALPGRLVKCDLAGVVVEEWP